ncbi:MAG TPA: hypothetical protein VFM05_14000 [Candidatus Saccharimonadales bacterium]|nr:hypothetical protein [Candidatus Saccharimonadales bacterium]
MRVINPFSGFETFPLRSPGLSLRSNPGLKLANAFGVLFKFKLTHHRLCGSDSVWKLTPKALANSSPGLEQPWAEITTISFQL